MPKTGVSIIVPAWNEEGNIEPLMSRIDAALAPSHIPYEVIVVDDHSTDRTWETAQKLSNTYPLKIYKKVGKKGKAFSLLEGFTYASYPILAILDADLQYPPEYLPQMWEKIQQGGDVIVANRSERSVSATRKVVSGVFRKFFAQFLHGFSLDVQSGMKMFRKKVIDHFSVTPSPWTFDLEFLLKARSAGYAIDSIDIPFDERQWGKSKINIVKSSWEIGSSAVKMKSKPAVVPLHPEEPQVGPGFHFGGNKYVHHSALPHHLSALYQLTFGQKIVMYMAAALFIGAAVINWHITIISTIAVITFIYFADLLFNLFLVFRSFNSSSQIQITDDELQQIPDSQLPTYTVFCPLYKEWEVVDQFVSAMSRLDYPKDKLQVMLLLEEDDTETISRVQAMNLPEYFQVVVVPHSLPKTKPKACNYGLTKATGEYAVIFDAEDVPDPLQLKKVVATFNRLGETTKCVQAKLNFYNPHQNLLTRMFTSEYSLWFDLILTGLQAVNAPIPLGGTSNHFRTKDLNELKGWDAFNVTEDCDLGMRLARNGYKTAIVDSVTLEEANSDYVNWFHQRTRWIKGYIQTYFVHMRHPMNFLKSGNILGFLAFQLIVGGKVLTMYINPLMWLITISYFALRPVAGDFIESFFPAPVFYMAVLSLVVGNFIYLYNYMIGTLRRGQDELVKYAYLVPLYWLYMSFAAFVALQKFITQPHHWAKTKHGLHIKNTAATPSSEDEEELIPPLYTPEWALTS